MSAKKRRLAEKLAAAPPGIVIRYAGLDEEGRQHVDYVPPQRDAVVVFKNAFGTVHAASFGDIDLEDPKVERAVSKLVIKLGLHTHRVED